VVIVVPEIVEFRLAVPHELDRKKAWRAHCPQIGAEINRAKKERQMMVKAAFPMRHLPRIVHSANPAQWEKASFRPPPAAATTSSRSI
jgi:hypothetical protein